VIATRKVFFSALMIATFLSEPAAATLCDGKFFLVNSTNYRINEFIVYKDGDATNLLIQPLESRSSGASSRQIALYPSGSAQFKIIFSFKQSVSGTINDLCANERTIVVTSDFNWYLQ